MKKKVLAVLLSLTVCATSVMSGVSAAPADEISGNSVQEFSHEETTDSEDSADSNADTSELSEDKDQKAVVGAVSEEDVQPSQTPVPEQTPVPTSIPETGEGESDSVYGEAGEILTVITASQANWVKDEQGYRLQSVYEEAGTVTGEETEEKVVEAGDMSLGDGFITGSQLESMNGVEVIYAKKDYYTRADGLISVQYDSKTSYYFFDEHGYLITGMEKVPGGTAGFKSQENGEYYFMEQSNSDFETTAQVGEQITPANSNLGEMQMKYWLWTGDSWRYYMNTYGTYATVPALWEANGKASYFKIGDDYYYLDEKGRPLTGYQYIADEKAYYYFDGESQGHPGKMVRNKWIESWDAEHETPSWKYFGSNGKRDAQKVGLQQLPDGYYYLLSPNGYLFKNTMRQAQNGYYYYAGDDCRIVKRQLVTWNGKRYYMSSNGARANPGQGWHKTPGTIVRYYYYDKNGAIVEKVGWHLVEDGSYWGWYFFSTAGNHYVNRWLVNGTYSFDSQGRLCTGVTAHEGKYYFFKATSKTAHGGQLVKNGWVKSGSNKYYANAKGELLTGWQWIGSNWYYMDPKTCAVVTNQAITNTKTGQKGWLDQNGAFITGGWYVENWEKRLVRYINPGTGELCKNGWYTIDGIKYKFDKDGYRINDLTDIVNTISGSYRLEVDRINGVVTVYKGGVPVRAMRTSVGLPETPTPTGTYPVSRAGRWQLLMGPSWGQYASHVDGAGLGGIFFHSVAGSAPNSYSLSAFEFNKLGFPASHGCIRLCVIDAKFIYDNCNGATVRIFDGTYVENECFKGPLGKPLALWIPGDVTYDPTDPNI